MTRQSSKSNKLRNVSAVRGRTGNVPIQKKKENLLCQNLSHFVYHKFFDKTNPFEIDKCKSRNGASVSEALALFNCNLS